MSIERNKNDGLQLVNEFQYIPDITGEGAGNLWEKHRVSRWTFAPTASEDATLVFTCPEDGTAVMLQNLVDSYCDTPVCATVDVNGVSQIEPILSNPGARAGVPAVFMKVKTGDRITFRISGMGHDGRAKWAIGIRYLPTENLCARERTPLAPQAAVTRADFLSAFGDALYLRPYQKDGYFLDLDGVVAAPMIEEFSERCVLPKNIAEKRELLPSALITKNEVIELFVNLWERIRGAVLTEDGGCPDTLTDKACALGLLDAGASLSDGKKILNGEEAEQLIALFLAVKSTPIRPTAAGEYSPVYRGIIREDVNIQALIDEAYYGGKGEVTIPPGIYRVFPQERPREEQNTANCPPLADGVLYDPRTHINLSRRKNFTIHAYGVTLLMQDRGLFGFCMEDCTNIRIEGVTVDYEQLIFTQSEIVAIDPEGKWFDFRIEDGYSSDFDNPRLFADTQNGEFYKKDRTYAMSTCGAVFSKKCLEKRGNDVYRLTDPHVVCTMTGIEVGDFFTFRGGPMNSAFNLFGADGSEFVDITVYTANVAFSLNYGDHDKPTLFERCAGIPGPAPLGALHARINSTSGTVFHCTGLRRGFISRDCTIRNNGDDGFNIHGVFHRLCEELGENTYVLAMGHTLSYVEAGDTLRVYTVDNDFITLCKVEECERLTDYETPIDLGVHVGVWTFRPRGYFKVKTDRPLCGALGAFVVDSSEITDGFRIENCRIVGGRARGILAKAGGVIEGCHVERRPVGIMIAPERKWLESDHVFGITVRNTTVKECGCGRHPHIYCGVNIGGYHGSRNHDILFEDCRFDNNLRLAMRISHAENITLRNCLFLPAPYAYADVTVDDSEGVRFENVRQESGLPIRMNADGDAEYWFDY